MLFQNKCTKTITSCTITLHVGIAMTVIVCLVFLDLFGPLWTSSCLLGPLRRVCIQMTQKV